MPEMSTLELMTLGLVWRRQPCTAYAIRTMLARSRASYWSGSAGTIYPLMRRLEQRGLLRSTAARTGKRPQRDYRITAGGTAAVRRWLRPPLPEADASIIYDPLRTRMLFQGVLPREVFEEFVADALEELRKQMPLMEYDCRHNPLDEDPFMHFATRNAYHIMRARIKWLKEVQSSLESGLPARSESQA